jgi:multifunctional methyltransferase subunit TRM112
MYPHNHVSVLVVCCLLYHPSSTTKGYPLKIEATNVVLEESPMDVGLVKRMVLDKVNYESLVGAVAEIRETGLVPPEQLPDIPSQRPDERTLEEGDGNNAVLEALHLVLFNLHVIEGALICPDTGRKFPIKDGIPNMILHADEL